VFRGYCYVSSTRIDAEATMYSPAIRSLRDTEQRSHFADDVGRQERTTMIDPTRRQRAAVARVLRFCGIALFLLAAACGNNSAERDPNISADDERSEGGALQALTVEGKDFTPNGPVLVTVVMAATGGNASPYVEETIQADGEGRITYERRPVPCPQPVDYERGSWINVVARDMTTGISGSDRLDPGREPDCRG
jgi:hypothetical protein